MAADAARRAVGRHQLVFGPDALLTSEDEHAVDRGRWTRGMLWSRANSITGGTSEIQRTVIGERLLGLPREPR